jgi:hypothetical protein
MGRESQGCQLIVLFDEMVIVPLETHFQDGLERERMPVLLLMTHQYGNCYKML